MAENGKPRYTDTEYDTYAREEMSTASNLQGVAMVIGLAAVGCLAIAPFVSVVLVMLLIPVGFAAYAARHDADEKVSAALRDERIGLQRGVGEVAKKLDAAVGDLMKVKAEGHVVMAGAGSVVIIESVVVESFKNWQHEDPLLADAITAISGEVERSKNKSAAAAWAHFLKELAGAKDKTQLESLWDNVVKHAPTVGNLIESVAKIVALFT